VPVLGPLYSQLLSGHSILVYIALLMVPLTWWVLYRTRFGLRLRAVGENPAAVDTAGVSVVRLRYRGGGICGVSAGSRGPIWRPALSAGFVKDMSAGRGFIALAALIFAKWRPWHALGAVLLFGFLEAIANRFPSLELGASRAGAVHAGPALHPDRGDPGRLRRQGDPAARRRRALCEGALRPPAPIVEDLAALIRARAGAPRCGSASCSARASATSPRRSRAPPSPTPTCPAFPMPACPGHNPKLVMGDLEGVRVAVFGGRAHYYESGRGRRMRLPLAVLKALGAEALILTNAAGSLHPDIAPAT
jgi:hypothetical protein